MATTEYANKTDEALARAEEHYAAEVIEALKKNEDGDVEGCRLRGAIRQISEIQFIRLRRKEGGLT